MKIDAFGKILKRCGIRHGAGVPCSFFTSLVNYMTIDPALDYISATSEGEAVAIAAGLVTSGKPAFVLMQNSGFGNAVNPITSMLDIYGIPVVLFVSHRGEPGIQDEPQHRRMGRIIEQLSTLCGLRTHIFEASTFELALEQAQHDGVPSAWIFRKGALEEDRAAPLLSIEVLSRPRAPEGVGRHRPEITREAALSAILPLLNRGVGTPDQATPAVVCTTGKLSRELYELDDGAHDKVNRFYMVGSMGCAAGFGLGVARGRPRRPVIVLDGDGAVLMKLGTLATAGYLGLNNFHHVVLDNGAHDSTGGQPTASAAVDFAAAALACGYRYANTVHDADEFARALNRQLLLSGPTILRMMILTGARANLGRPALSPVAGWNRFRAFLQPQRGFEDRQATLNPRRTVLLNPGPVTLTERVRAALLREDQCHREPEFAEMTLDIKSRLVRLYCTAETDFEAVLLTGSGTCAVEAMISSLAPNREKTMVLANGVYGERMAMMLAAHGKPHVVLYSDWLKPIDLAAAERILRQDTLISHVATVHHETTTGRLNDVQAVADLCQRHNKQMLLDAVSSFGGEAIDFGHPSLLAAASTGNKCLHGIVGVCFVLVRKNVFKSCISGSSTIYLDLFRYEKDQRQGYSPFTQAVHSCFAIQEALHELEDGGGWRARRERYRQLSSAIRAELGNRDIQLLIPEEVCSSMLSSFRLPKGWNYTAVHNALREAGFVIYAGQGALSDSVFRLCTMGDIQDDDLQRLLATFASVFKAAPNVS